MFRTRVTSNDCFSLRVAIVSMCWLCLFCEVQRERKEDDRSFFLDIAQTDEDTNSHRVTRKLEKKGWAGACVVPFGDLQNRTCKPIMQLVSGRAGMRMKVTNCQTKSWSTRQDELLMPSKCREEEVVSTSIVQLLQDIDAPETISMIALDIPGMALDILSHFPFGRHCASAWLVVLDASSNHSFRARQFLEEWQGCRIIDAEDYILARCECNTTVFTPSGNNTAEIFERRATRNSEFFDGASKVLESCVASHENGVIAEPVMVDLAFAYLYEKSYQNCASTFTQIARDTCRNSTIKHCYSTLGKFCQVADGGNKSSDKNPYLHWLFAEVHTCKILSDEKYWLIRRTLFGVKKRVRHERHAEASTLEEADDTDQRRDISKGGDLGGETYSKQDLIELFFARRKREGTEFFEGAIDLLQRILSGSAEDSDIAPREHLGFAYLHKREYSLCARTFIVLHNAMRKSTNGPGFLANFCKDMANGWTLRAVVPLRQAFEAMEDEDIEEERLKLIHDLLQELDHFFWRNTRAKIDEDVPFPPNVAPEWYVPGLLARPFHDASRFAAGKALEAASDVICAEVDAFLLNSGDAGLKPVGVSTEETDANLTAKGEWSDYSIFYGGVPNEQACEQHFPRTCKLFLDEIPEALTNPLGLVSVSQLLPGTEIALHRGPSNAQLTYHLGIQVPESAGIRVGNQTRGWQRGKVTMFDDSYEHEVWHHGAQDSGPRVVLVVRIWHPELTLPERIHRIWQEERLSAEDRKNRIVHLKTQKAKKRWEQEASICRSSIDGVAHTASRLEL